MAANEIDDIIRKLIELQVEENRLLNRLQHLRTENTKTGRDPAWVKGDRVRITNTVTARGDKANDGDRLATVRKFVANYKNGQTQVFVTTDNGLDTWRLEKNLRWISRNQPKHE